MKPKILLTGATGFVGTNFVLQLHDQYAITALVRENSDISKIESHCEIYRYKDLDSILQLFQKEHFDGVVHLATLYLANHTPQDIKSLVDSNVYFGSALLEACKLNPPRFFINTSTFSEYSNAISYNPLTFYDATKQAFYDICKYYAQILPTTIAHLLLYATYGNNDTRPKIFNLWQKIAKSGESLAMSAGEQRLDISHIFDVVSGYAVLIQLCLENRVSKNRIYTLENKRYTLRELAALFEKYTNSTLRIEWGAKPYRQNEIMEPISAKDSNLLEILPNWNPKISLEQGLKILNQKPLG